MTLPFEYRYLIVLLAGLSISLIVTPLGKWLGERYGVVVYPGGRRKHHGSVSLLGGIGIAAGFFGALLVSRLLPIPTADTNESRRFWGLLIGSAWMFIFGLLDDRYELPAGTEYLGYLLAAIIAIVTLIILQQFNNPLTNTLIELSAWFYVPLTIFWMTGMMVTVNWLDGLDGLVAGVAVILSLILGIHMFRMGQYSVVPQAIAVLGASLGFLMYNIFPARVFMGSNGAFMLGYLMGALGLIAGGRVATVLLVMGIPIIDVAWTIFDRWRHGVSIFQGDRRHLHFRLQDAGYSPRVIVFFYWGLCALLGTLALVISSRLYKLVALLVLGGVMLGFSLYLSRKNDG
ncbi:MAG: undecaprenyl/decaprenyl-phosphate alpha-N-acetylglucosaminyl 1-phosphate transferase [Anaerolineae bacterium]|nr:undecaprenyl/decaprenyl-phosphate alpha-N-acetylglucosaminyl 1-phosphate transferase [Anaerolineae bacterium]